MTRTVIVDAGSAMRLQPSARVLHRYANGEVLLSTDGPGVEAERDAALPLVLPEQVRGQLDAARATLDAVPDGLRIPAYVELLGPPDGAMLAQLRHIGVMPQQFVPARSYLCVGTGAQLRAARKLPFVAAVTPVNRNLKPQPLTGEDPAAYIAVSVVASAALADADTLAHELAGVDGVRVDGPAETAGALVSLPARINGSGKEALLNDPRILRIEPRAPRQVEDEVADLIVAGRYSASGQPAGSYVEWLDDHGISGAGVTIGIVDQGVDITHPAFTGRINDLAGGKRDWHGTFVAGHAAGAFMDHRDGAGFVYGIGIAPSATLLAQDNQKSGSELGAETVDAADGAAAIQNNSWGAGLQDPMDYQSQEAIYDGLVRNAARSGAAVPLTICFSSGNNGEDGLTRPKAAKNLIISGNSESYRPDVGGAESDDIRQVYSGAHASSHGNCGDGRIRPHVVAPGEWTASANYDSHPGEKEYVDDKITWGGGSSGASPKTAGACALLTHWWRNHNNGALPSPAMLRALVVNGAEPIDAGGTIPNMVQGWGRLNVDNIVRDDVHRTFIDQSILLTTRGDSRSWTICPSDPSQPLYITLAWTDPPGAPGTGTASAPAVVNKLALRVSSKGQLYRANQFEQGWSRAGGPAEREGWDNTQCIHLKAGEAGDFIEISVTAIELAMNCLNNSADTPQQDFALVVRNGFLDRGMTPADLFLILDGGSASPAAPQDDHYAPGSSDHDVLDDPLPPAAGPEPGAGDGDGASGQAGDDPADDDPAVDDWWREDDELASETVRPPRSLPGALRAAAAAGMSLAQGAGNLASNGADPPDAVVDLEIALARLDRTWAGYDATRRRAAVLTVGDATRVTSGAIDILRRLAFRGELWILSTTPSILRFLAQRVHRRHGVRYRLCEPGELAGALRDTLAIAAGLQRLITHGTRGVDRSLQVSFAVVPDDLALVIRVQGPGVSQLQLQLKDGHGQSMLVGAADAPPAIQVMPGAHGLELRRALGPQDAGTWTLVVPPEAAERAGVMVYARTRLGVRALATDTGAAGSMVSVKGGEQSRLGKLQLDRRLIDGAAKGSEQRRLVEVAARTSRIDARGKAGEAPREALVPSLGAFLAMPPAGSGARVLDLRISARGVRGRYDFGRLVHADLVSLERRSVWRARLAPQAPVTLRAQVSDIQRDDGGVAALTLRRGAIGRRVRVRSPALRTALRDMDFNNPSLLFTVRGHELVSVVTQVRGASMRYKVRRSMGGELGSLAGLEPPVPMVETAQCDYAGASRFVQAKHFQAKPNGRTISRVVIHITDGGANIEGTIGWFKNPVAKNGTEVPVSAHYVVGQDGQVVQMVREQDVAYHANAANGDSIGIEHCARSKKALSATDPGLLPTETQYAASAALVRDICKRHGIPLDRAHVLGHNEADTKTTHKGCPTNAWDWTYYVDLLLKAPPAPAGLDTGTPTAEPAGGGEPTDTTEEPTDTTEEPTDTTEEPTDTTEEPTDTTEEPTDTTEEPTDTTEEPTDTTEEPIDTGEEPTDTTEEPIDTGEEPAEPEIESSAEYLRALAEHIVRRAARIPQGPDLEPSAARFAVGARFSNAADIDQWFQARMGHGFIDWFNTTCAGKEAWANAAIGTPAADPAALQQRFAAIWDRIPQMFGTPSITLLHFASLMTLMITEAGTDLLPASEPPNPANAKRAAGIAALFDAARSRGKASYNVAPNRTAYDLFHDPVFLGAHRQLPFGDVLANTADTRWKGVSYPAGDYPVSADPSVDGFILQADFFKFRGRGLVKITGRSEYYELIAFVQGYAGPEPTISRYRQAWAGRTADEIATTSRTEHWDELFQQTYFDIPCAAIRLHSTAHGNYLNLADDTAQLNAVGPGSFGSLWHMGWQVGRSRAYADLFKRRVVALLHTLAQGAGMSVRSEADRLRALAIDQAAPVRRPLSSAILIPQKTVEPYHGRDPRGVLGRRVLRPDWINGTVPFIPTPPVPKLGEPVVAGDFLLFPDPNNGRTFYTLARPVLRRAALVVYISRIESEGGTSYGVTSANASITVAVYADGDPTAIEGYRQQWIAALVQQGMANADATRFLPLRLRDLKPSLVPSPQEAGGEVQALTALDAGTITFTVPLNSVGALVWQQLFTTSQGYRLGGTCSIEASYFAQADTNLQVDTRVLSCTLGTLLAAVRPEDVTVVNPQQTVPIQVLVSPYSLVDSVSVDVLPSEGASAQALAFTSEGGQVQIPITSSNLAGVRVSYNATVRFKPTGWRVITQKGSLALPHEWDINVNPDSWVTNYNVCAIVLDAQNKVTSGAAADLTDIFTVRLDYSHPALSGPPLSLVFQTASQEMVSVPFPWPPDSLAPPTLTLTVFGQRQGAPVGPVTRVLSYDETQIVIKVYINGAIECFTNKTPAGETSIESELMRVLEHVH